MSDFIGDVVLTEAVLFYFIVLTEFVMLFDFTFYVVLFAETVLFGFIDYYALTGELVFVPTVIG